VTHTIEEILRLNTEENNIIKLVRVDEIVPIAVKVVDNDGLENIEVIKSSINGGVNRV
jgi:hypothetical protein